MNHFKLNNEEDLIISKLKKMIVVKVGDENRPAGPKDIKEVQDKIKEILESHGDIGVLSVHHAVDIEVIEIRGE